MIDKALLLSVGFIVYTYAGYPLLLWAWNFFRKKEPLEKDVLPSVTVLMSAYNEESCIAQTLDSILASDYPPELLDVLVVSDGSTDKTNIIVSSYPSEKVHLVPLFDRQGKPKALSLAYPQAKGEILVLTDASSVFQENTVKQLMRHFGEPRVGSVSGSKTILKTGGAVSRGDGLYWRYDALLRSLESQTGSSWVGCEGGLYAIRKSLFKLDYPPDLANDYAVCCRVFEQGFQNRYDPQAFIYEAASQTIGIEFMRKVRVIVRGLRAFFAFGYLLNPFKNFSFFFQNISHRLCRWLVPFFLLFLLVGCRISLNPFLQFLFYVQCVFYSAGFLAFILKKLNLRIRITSIPLYFIVVNGAAFVSWFLVFKKYGVWTPTIRENISTVNRLEMN